MGIPHHTPLSLCLAACTFKSHQSTRLLLPDYRLLNGQDVKKESPPLHVAYAI